jgi:hypothetical protein
LEYVFVFHLCSGMNRAGVFDMRKHVEYPFKKIRTKNTTHRYTCVPSRGGHRGGR